MAPHPPQEITGIDDEAKSLHILSTHHWDLEVSPGKCMVTRNQSIALDPLRAC